MNVMNTFCTILQIGMSMHDHLTTRVKHDTNTGFGDEWSNSLVLLERIMHVFFVGSNFYF